MLLIITEGLELVRPGLQRGGVGPRWRGHGGRVRRGVWHLSRVGDWGGRGALPQGRVLDGVVLGEAEVRQQLVLDLRLLGLGQELEGGRGGGGRQRAQEYRLRQGGRSALVTTVFCRTHFNIHQI